MTFDECHLKNKKLLSFDVVTLHKLVPIWYKRCISSSSVFHRLVLKMTFMDSAVSYSEPQENLKLGRSPIFHISRVLAAFPFEHGKLVRTRHHYAVYGVILLIAFTTYQYNYMEGICATEQSNTNKLLYGGYALLNIIVCTACILTPFANRNSITMILSGNFLKWILNDTAVNIAKREISRHFSHLQDVEIKNPILFCDNFFHIWLGSPVTRAVRFKHSRLPEGIKSEAIFHFQFLGYWGHQIL